MFAKNLTLAICFSILTTVNVLLAETISFSLKQFKIDALKRQISTLQSDSVKAKRYQNYQIPVLVKQLSDLVTIPQKVTVSNLIMQPLTTDLTFQPFQNDSLRTISEYSNRPLVISASGFSRGNGILNLEFCPFIFRHDTLFFVEQFDYQFSDYQKPFLTNDKAAEINDLLIISLSEFAPELDRYRQFKQQSGLKTRIAYIENIVQNTQGKDNAHKIRNFIKECYRTEKIRYAILVGGPEIIPVVVFKKDANASYDAAPSDQFYSNFDKEFDSNNNGIYADDNDLIDLYPDILVGRWPASSVNEVKTIVNKTINYLSGTVSNYSDYYKKLLLFAFNLTSPGDSEYFCNSIETSAGSGLLSDKLYVNSTPNINQAMALNKLNQGANLVYALAHGATYKFGVNMGWGIYGDHVYNSTTPAGLYFIASCNTGNFPAYGLVVKALLSPLGGSVNYIGSSNLEYLGITRVLHNLFFQQLATKNTIGAALDYARKNGIPDLSAGSDSKQQYFAYNLQGDPSNYLFMHQPIDNSITNLSVIKKGTASLTGNFAQIPTGAIRVTLLANNQIITSSLVTGNQFTLSYNNLFADSVTLAISSADILFKKITVATVANSQDLQVKEFKIIDANNSGIVEHRDRFAIAFKLLSTQNSPLTDSLKVVFRTATNSFSSIICDSVMLAWPEIGVTTDKELFNFLPEFASITRDTTISCLLNFFPAVNQYNSAQSPIFQQNFLMQVANPKLQISWAKYPNVLNMSPVLVNNSAGKIDQAVISLAAKSSENQNKELTFTLKNIPGKSLLHDSLTFACNQSIPQRLQIVQNSQSAYFTSYVQKSTLLADQIQSLNLNCYNIADDLLLKWKSYDQTIAYNLFIYVNDTILSVAPVNKQLLTRAELQYNISNLPALSSVYVRVGLVDKQNGDQFAISKFIKINLVPQYEDAPYSLMPFKLYNPTLVKDKIVANTESGSLVSIPRSGNVITGNGTFYQAVACGFNNDYYQGKAFGDVNNDGQDEIVYFSNSGIADSVYLNVVSLQSGLLLKKRTIFGTCMYATPVLANIDNDFEPEILFSLFNTSATGVKGGYLYAFDFQDGNLLSKSGYPIISTLSTNIAGAPVVADLDNNGVKEILFSCGASLELYNLQNMNKIAQYLLNNPIVGDLIVCDLNNDGKLEIICLESNASASGAKLKTFSYSTNNGLTPYWSVDGNSLDMYAYAYSKPGSAPVIADIDLDGQPEIIAVTGKKLYAFKNDGTIYPNYPINIPQVATNNVSCPSLADLDGDSKLDIVFMDNSSNIYAYSGSNGTILPGFPLTVPNSYRIQFGSLNIADLDHDNDLEILAGALGGKMYIFDYPKQSSGRQIYSSYRGDLANSGLFNRSDITSSIEQSNSPNQFEIISQYPNPFNPTTWINFYLPKPHEVQFKVFNTLGQLVYQQSNKYLYSGIKSINFNGANLSSGLYIYSLRYDNVIKTGKCTLLK